MLLVQLYLDMFGLDALIKQYSIKVQRHPKYNNLVHLKYDQINSPMSEPIVQECRGLILNENDAWDVVAHPFDKFFNHGEGFAAPIDWASARVQEKLDGSLMYLYHYNQEWHVATSGRPAADGDINGKSTFAELFWDVWINQFEVGAEGEGEFPTLNKLDAFKTYIFELTAPENRVVVPHVKRSLTLIGVRDRRNGKEDTVADYTQFSAAGNPDLNPVTEYSLSSVDDMIKTFETMKPLEQEGYVVVDKNFNRIKVKHPGYVAIHHAKDSVGTSRRAIVEIVRTGEMNEVLAHFPELKAAYDEEAFRYGELCTHINVTFGMYKNIEVQKDFALAVKDLPWSAALFALRNGRAKTPADWLAQAPIDAVIKLMDASVD